jgi:uridine kinase
MTNGYESMGFSSINSSRKTIEIVLPDGRVFTGSRGSSLLELMKMLPEWETPPIMGAIVNGELRELTYTLDMDARVRPVTMAEDDGARIYRRTITFLLEAAFEEYYPKVKMTWITQFQQEGITAK